MDVDGVAVGIVARMVGTAELSVGSAPKALSSGTATGSGWSRFVSVPFCSSVSALCTSSRSSSGDSGAPTTCVGKKYCQHFLFVSNFMHLLSL